MPLNIKLHGIEKGCIIHDDSLWRVILFQGPLYLTDSTIKELGCFNFWRIPDGWVSIKSIIRDKLWVFVKEIYGKTMNLYFIDFWFDASKTLNVKSITYEEMQEMIT